MKHWKSYLLGVLIGVMCGSYLFANDEIKKENPILPPTLEEVIGMLEKRVDEIDRAIQQMESNYHSLLGRKSELIYQIKELKETFKPKKIGEPNPESTPSGEEVQECNP